MRRCFSRILTRSCRPGGPGTERRSSTRRRIRRPQQVTSGRSRVDTKVSTPIVNTSKDERYGAPSPDGHWLAYVTNDSDTYQVNLASLHGAGVRRQISIDGGSQPQWIRNGHQLVYMAPDRVLRSVAIRTSAESLSHEPPADGSHSNEVAREPGDRASVRHRLGWPALPGGECHRGSEIRVDRGRAELAVGARQVIAATAASGRTPANGRSARTRW